MKKHDYLFRLEMAAGQDMRQVYADAYATEDEWVVFYVKPPQGGIEEYLRVNKSLIISLETVRQ